MPWVFPVLSLKYLVVFPVISRELVRVTRKNINVNQFKKQSRRGGEERQTRKETLSDRRT